MAGRRVKHFLFPVQMFWDMLKPDVSVHFQGIPAGGKVWGVYHDSLRNAFVFVVEHPDFEEVPEGAIAPVADEFLKFRHSLTISCQKLADEIESRLEDIKDKIDEDWYAGQKEAYDTVLRLLFP